MFLIEVNFLPVVVDTISPVVSIIGQYLQLLVLLQGFFSKLEISFGIVRVDALTRWSDKFYSVSGQI